MRIIRSAASPHTSPMRLLTLHSAKAALPGCPGAGTAVTAPCPTLYTGLALKGAEALVLKGAAEGPPHDTPLSSSM